MAGFSKADVMNVVHQAQHGLALTGNPAETTPGEMLRESRDVLIVALARLNELAASAGEIPMSIQALLDRATLDNASRAI